IRLAQSPGGLFIDIGVASKDSLHPRFQTGCESQLLKGYRQLVGASLADLGLQRAIHIEYGRGYGEGAAAILGNEAQDPLCQVVEDVGQFGVVAADDSFRRLASIQAKAELSQQEITERFDSERVRQIARISVVTERLRFRLTPIMYQAVGKPGLRQRHAGALQ